MLLEGEPETNEAHSRRYTVYVRVPEKEPVYFYNLLSLSWEHFKLHIGLELLGFSCKTEKFEKKKKKKRYYMLLQLLLYL